MPGVSSPLPGCSASRADDPGPPQGLLHCQAQRPCATKEKKVEAKEVLDAYPSNCGSGPRRAGRKKSKASVCPWLPGCLAARPPAPGVWPPPAAGSRRRAARAATKATRSPPAGLWGGRAPGSPTARMGAACACGRRRREEPEERGEPQPGTPYWDSNADKYFCKRTGREIKRTWDADPGWDE